MKRVVMVGEGSLKDTIRTVTSNIQGSTTIYKNTETGELSTEMLTNTMFEITNILRDKEIKSGREKRRIKRQEQRRKQQRKK